MNALRQPLVLLLSLSLCAGLAPAYAKDHGDKHRDKEEAKAAKHEEKEERKAAEHAQKEWEHQRKEREKDWRHERKEAEKQRREAIRYGGYFNEHQRSAVRSYYVEHYREGRRCPPGLAKKHDGCVPPGHARAYTVGQPLRVAYYAVPQPVLVQLPPPPPGYRYVSANGDVLLVTIGTLVVVDALANLLN